MNSYQVYSDSSFLQHTLKESFTCIGKGLHSGLRIIMTVMPSEENTGYRFVRRDLPTGYNEIIASWHTVSDTHLCTTISNNTGARVSTIEHLMAALQASGVDNAHIVLDGPEVPIMDGSAKSFIELIDSVGVRAQKADRKAIVIKSKVEVGDGDISAAFVPDDERIIDVTIRFDSEAIGEQRMVTPVTRDIFRAGIAEARTFGFSEQIATLQKLGFARGGSLKNAILVGPEGVINEEGLRFTDEFVRHKVLDCIGDLALSGAYIIGRYVGHQAGHTLTNTLIRSLLLNSNAYEFTTLKKAGEVALTPHVVNYPSAQNRIRDSI